MHELVRMLQSSTALRAQVVLVNDTNETVRANRSGGKGKIREKMRRLRPIQAATRSAESIDHNSSGDGKREEEKIESGNVSGML